MGKKNVSGFRDLAASLADDPDEAPILKETPNDLELFHGNTFIRDGHDRPTDTPDDAMELISVRLSQEVKGKLREAGPGW